MSAISRFLGRLNTGTVHFIRTRYVKEDWAAHVMGDGLFMTRGTIVFFLGTCQEVVDRAFASGLSTQKQSQGEPVTNPEEA